MGQYLQMIIWTMLFVVVIEMVFPSSDMKKYLKLILGFVVIYIIVGPIVDFLVGRDILPEERVANYISYYQNQLTQGVVGSDYDEEITSQKTGMVAIYKANVEEQAKALIEKNIPVEVCEIAIETGEDEAAFEIESLTLEVAYLENGENKFGLGLGSKEESIVLHKENLENQIKKCLNDFYNWDNTNIYITVQEN